MMNYQKRKNNILTIIIFIKNKSNKNLDRNINIPEDDLGKEDNGLVIILQIMIIFMELMILIIIFSKYLLISLLKN